MTPTDSEPTLNTPVHGRMKVPTIRVMAVQISRFGLAALFLFTAGAKLWIIKAFAGNVAELLSAIGLAQSRWTWPATVAVIVGEIITAICLLVPRTVRTGALLSVALLIGFSAFALYYRFGLGNADGLECGCFGGIIASQLGVTTALRNLALLIPALLVWFKYRRWGTRSLDMTGPDNAVG